MAALLPLLIFSLGGERLSFPRSSQITLLQCLEAAFLAGSFGEIGGDDVSLFILFGLLLSLSLDGDGVEGIVIAQ